MRTIKENDIHHFVLWKNAFITIIVIIIIIIIIVTERWLYYKWNIMKY